MSKKHNLSRLKGEKKLKLKRLLILVIGLAVSVALIGCGETSQTPASTPSKFEKVSSENIDLNTRLEVVKHKETGCYYLMSNGYQKGGITQMFIKEEGESIPYCE